MKTFSAMPRHPVPFSRAACLSLVVAAVVLLAPQPVDGQARAGKASTLTVVSDDNYPPYVFRDADGNLKGILPDEWALWEQKTGVKVNLKAMDWIEAQRVMREGGADVIDTIFLTEERARLYDFTPPYAQIQVPVFAHRTLGGIGDISSLKGFTIGVKAGDAVIGHLTGHGIHTLKEYPSYESIIQAAKNQEIRIFSVDEPAAVYFMYKHGIAHEFRQCFVLYTGEFHRAVAKNRADMLNLVQSGFNQISRREYRAIERKWIGSPFLLREIADQWGGYILLAVAIIVVLVAGNAYLSHRVRVQTAELHRALEELRQSQARLQSILKVAPVGIGVIADRRFLEVNDMFCRMSGYSSEEVVGQSSRLFYASQEDFERIGKLFFEQIAKDGFGALEAPIRHRSGRMMCWWLSGTPIDPARPAAGFIFAVQDITERKKTEEERLHYERKMQESQKLESLGMLAGGIAHDFNNLLAAIMGNIDLALISLPKESPAREDILAAVNATKRAADLVQQMLAYSGRGHTVATLLDIPATFGMFLDQIKDNMPKNATLNLNLPESLPAIEADVEQLRLVVMNLVSNAAEALETRQGTINISAGTVDSSQLSPSQLWPRETLLAGPYVYIEVADTGIGMPAERIPKIFDPFFSTKFTGRGLGLPAVLGILRGHKGAIQIESTPGKGTTVRALFPAAPPDAELPS